MMHNLPTTSELHDDVRLPRLLGWAMGFAASIVMWAAILSGIGAI